MKDSEKVSFENDAWLQLRAYVLLKHDLHELDETHYVCQYCRTKLNSNTIPPRSTLNGLEVDDIPKELRSLNIFEQILIQKAKAFQTVIRLGPVKNKLPYSEKLKGIKGRVIYLPVPLQNNINVLPSCLPNHELHILMNGVPTKNRIIWQDIVQVDKIHAAIEKLHEINPLYEDVKLPADQINDYVYSGAEEIEAVNLNDPDAILQKITANTGDNIYQHYSIHPIESKKEYKQ